MWRSHERATLSAGSRSRRYSVEKVSAGSEALSAGLCIRSLGVGPVHCLPRDTCPHAQSVGVEQRRARLDSFVVNLASGAAESGIDVGLDAAEELGDLLQDEPGPDEQFDLEPGSGVGEDLGEVVGLPVSFLAERIDGRSLLLAENVLIDEPIQAGRELMPVLRPHLVPLLVVGPPLLIEPCREEP